MKRDNDDLVVVLETTDPGLLAVIESLFDASGIRYIVQGAAGVNLFPLGAAGANVTGRRTGARVLVEPEHADEARKLLESEPG